jgi:CheY-like chemotaxis protein
MKSFLFCRRNVLRFGGVLFLLLSPPQSSSLFAQNAPRPNSATTAANRLLPPLEITPSTLGVDRSLTLRLPPDFPLSNSRLRLGLYEAGQERSVSEVLRNWQLVNGRLQLTLQVEADPGRYELRLIASDKARSPITAAAELLVPGIDREPGWWLVNGSPFVQTQTTLNTTPSTANLPLWVPGLRRDQKTKSNADLPLPGATNLRWRTVQLPAVQTLLRPNYDWNDLQRDVASQLQTARASGEFPLLGFVLPVDDSTLLPPAATVQSTLKRLRAELNRIAPDAALLLSVQQGSPAFNAQALETYQAARFDAVILAIRGDDTGEVWPVKVARRIAEEQPSYDLPIFVAPVGDADAMLQLDAFMGGATGFLGDSASSGWQRIVQRNLALFVGSVTLEDTGLWPISASAAGTETNIIDQYEALRNLGRIPLLARIPNSREARRSESFMARLGESVEQSTLDALRSAASGGARIYVEGAPASVVGDKTTDALGALFKATIKEVPRRRTAMTLGDVWTFGTASGQRVPVEQTVSIAMQSTPVKSEKGAPQPRKGLDVLTEPRVIAQLPDGSPAVVVIPVGQGEIVWLPHRTTSAAVPSNDAQRLAPVQQFYLALAAYLQPALVQVRERDLSASTAPNTDSVPNEETTLPPAQGVRVALRASAKGTLLLAILNSGSQPRKLAVEATTPAGVVLDLATEQEVDVVRRGFASVVDVDLPARGWKLLALSRTRKDLEDERNTPRLKARLR